MSMSNEFYEVADALYYCSLSNEELVKRNLTRDEFYARIESFFSKQETREGLKPLFVSIINTHLRNSPNRAGVIVSHVIRESESYQLTPQRVLFRGFSNILYLTRRILSEPTTSNIVLNELKDDITLELSRLSDKEKQELSKFISDFT